MNIPTFEGPDPEPGFECDSRRIPFHVKEDMNELPHEELLLRIYRESLRTAQGDGGRISKTIGKACVLLARISREQDQTARKLVCLGWLTFGISVVLLIVTLIDVFKK